jgi:hypothetical protein
MTSPKVIMNCVGRALLDDYGQEKGAIIWTAGVEGLIEELESIISHG